LSAQRHTHTQSRPSGRAIKHHTRTQHSVWASPQSRSARLHCMRVAGNTLEASCCRTCRRRCAKRRLRRLLAADGGWARWARCLAPNMGRTIVGNGDVGRGNPGAIGGRERREQPRRPLPPGVLTGFSGRVRASVYFPMFPRPRSWMTPGDGPPTSAAVSTLPPRPPPPLGRRHARDDIHILLVSSKFARTWPVPVGKKGLVNT